MFTDEERLILEFDKLRNELVIPPNDTSAILSAIMVQPTLKEKVKQAQKLDVFLIKMKKRAEKGDIQRFKVASDGMLFYEGWVCVPNDGEIKEEIWKEAHYTPYTAHPGGTKMYRDLRTMFGGEL